MSKERQKARQRAYRKLSRAHQEEFEHLLRAEYASARPGDNMAPRRWEDLGPDPRWEEAAAAIEAGASLREVGQLYGVSGERVRQWVGRVRPAGFVKDMWAERRRRHQRAVGEAVEAELEARKAEYRDRNWKCSVCSEIVMRSRRGRNQESACGTMHVTCSSTCAEAWRVLRWVLCGGCRDAHLAQCYRTPSWKARGYTPSGSYTQSIRRGSKTHRYLSKFRPDVLEGPGRILFADEVDRPQWTGHRA